MTGKITLKWQRIASSDDLRRSSQTIGVANGRLDVFGGELKPREPVDNKLYHVDLQAQSAVTVSEPMGDSPAPRVGSASTTLGGTMYLFSGRGNVAMAPIDEQGKLWACAGGNNWQCLEPSDPSKPVPPPRSYHAMANDGRDAIYVHAGCSESGRLNDLWAFVVSGRRWVQLASAPGSERGGTSIAFCASEDALYRLNGFDGKSEIGGTVDVYNPVNNHWTSKEYNADGVEGPVPRSVSTLLCLDVGGKSWLVTAFGERDPSSLGHQGAGKMLSDVWAYDIKEHQWFKVEAEGGDEAPEPRGWFAADVLGTDTIVVHGGLAEDNSRLGDVWLGRLRVE
ncbi:uncharacterized protein PV09_05580 [Verruconis gallopava]|uniref:Nitrile-specifier protein 5 n=1 Tax=Verruconis gallopava TaxID=253628 RepID=A0A0D1YRX3_9PEZI|nr:uncharacterized protein PV09_05580 [Verruconis gallopava]KIW03372.1 hypothetical protein PV09_05580 [Verruconis gallopava]